MNSSVPKFLTTLYHILSTEDQRIIGWTIDGEAFQVKKVELLERKILPKYFKHKKMSSFQRQLNYFGFRKWTKTQTTICTFSHSNFRRHCPEELVLINKKPSSAALARELGTPQPKQSLGKRVNDFDDIFQQPLQKQAKVAPFPVLEMGEDFTSDDLLDVFLNEVPLEDLEFKFEDFEFLTQEKLVVPEVVLTLPSIIPLM